MKKLPVINLLLIFFCYATTANAQAFQSENLNFKTYNTSQGLADNVVLKTLKDKYGFLWIATHNGISRFDGRHFKNYSYQTADSNGLRSIWVTDLILDKNKTLWATTEWGLCYYDNTRDKFTYINNKNDIQVLYKSPLYAGDDEFIWVAAEDGLKKVNTLTKTFTSTSLKRIADPQFVIQYKKNIFLIGTRGKGLFKYNSLSNTWEIISIAGLEPNTHYTDALMEQNNLWITTDVGMLQLSENATNVYASGKELLQGKSFSELMCVQSFKAAFNTNLLVCGTNDKKLLLFDKTKKAFIYEWPSTLLNPEGFSPSVVYNLFEDENSLWIGTGKGLYQLNLNEQQKQTTLLPASQTKEVNELFRKVLSVKYTNENYIWLIPWQPNTGIQLYSKQQQKIIAGWGNNSNSKGKQYFDIIEANNEEVIAVGAFAVDYYAPKKGLVKTIPIKNKIYCAFLDEENNLWLGSDKGIIYLNTKTRKTENYAIEFTGTDIEKKSFAEEFPVSDIKKDAANTIWLASIKYGLFSFNITTKKVTAYRQKFSTAYSTLNRCSSLALVGNDSVWVGSMAGLSCFIPSQNKFYNYNHAQGLKSIYVYSLAADSAHNIWGRGNADIFKFNTTTKIASGYNLNPTLNSFYYLQKLSFASNKIWLGHENGFTNFTTLNNTDSNFKSPAVLITSCNIENEKYNFNLDSAGLKPIQLLHIQNQISFEYTAIEYNHPEEIEYWYKLEGLNKKWINGFTKNTVSYNNLLPGNYNFKLYVVNKRNHTQSETSSFLFKINPALWQRWWFWPLIALAFVLLVIIIAKKRIASIRKKEEEKTAASKMLAELETKMLRSQMNPHFIFNSLNSVQKYIWENKEEDAAEYLARFAKLIRAILENSQKEFITVQEEVTVLKNYIDLEHLRSNGHFDYRIKIDENLNQEKVLMPPLIMQPFIENAIWHGLNKKETKGNLSVSILKQNEKLVCIIDDDGAGRQKEAGIITKQNKALGVHITQQRINKLIDTTGQFASVEIIDKKENGIAKGTCVIITLPWQTI